VDKWGIVDFTLVLSLLRKACTGRSLPNPSVLRTSPLVRGEQARNWGEKSAVVGGRGNYLIKD